MKSARMACHSYRGQTYERRLLIVRWPVKVDILPDRQDRIAPFSVC